MSMILCVRGFIVAADQCPFIYTHVYIHTVIDIKAGAVWCVSPLGHSQMSSAWGTEGRHTHTHTSIGAYTFLHTHMQACRKAGDWTAYQAPTGPQQAPQQGSDGLWHWYTICNCVTLDYSERERNTKERRGGERKGGRGERRSKRRRGRQRDQTRSSFQRASLCLSLRDTSLSWKKRLNPQQPPSPNLPSPFSSSWSSSCCPCFFSLSLSAALCWGTVVSQL